MSHVPRLSKRLRLILFGILPLLGLTLVINAMTGTAMAAPTRPHAVHGGAPTGPVVGKHRMNRPFATEGGVFSSSENWAGYVTTNTAGTNTTSFNKVQAQWTVPSVTCDTSKAPYSNLFWVGLDGWNNGTVEQGGTASACQTNGTVEYLAWWETFPNGANYVFNVTPGDTIQASVTYNTAAGQFDIVVDDVTSGQSLNEAVSCPGGSTCTRSTAEVISEGTANYALPDYGVINYNAISVTDVNGHTGTLSDSAWQWVDVSQVSGWGVTQQSPSALSPDGSSFSISYVTSQWCDNKPHVSVSYYTFNTNSTANVIQPNIELNSTACASFPLSNFTIRYWFTEDGTQPLSYACNYGNVVPCSDVTSSFTAVPPVTHADHYLQLGFTSAAGNLLNEGTAGVIEGQFNQANFATMTQTNDYSFAADTTLTVTPDITVYYNGTLIYGTEPS